MRRDSRRATHIAPILKVLIVELTPTSRATRKCIDMPIWMTLEAVINFKARDIKKGIFALYVPAGEELVEAVRLESKFEWGSDPGGFRIVNFF